MVCVANSSVPHHNVMLLEAQTCMCYWCHQYIIVSKLFNWLFILLGFIVHTASIHTHTHTQQLMLQCDASLTLCARYVSNRVIAHPYHVIMSQARQASLLSTAGRPFSFLSSFLHLSLRAPGFTNPLELLFYNRIVRKHLHFFNPLLYMTVVSVHRTFVSSCTFLNMFI